MAGPSTDGKSVERTSRLAWLALIPAAIFAAATYAFATGALPLVGSHSWAPSLGISLAFHLDGLALQFVLLITGVGTLVFVYGGGYMAGYRHRVRLYVLLLVFMVAMLGCVTADDLIVLFLFWEMTSLSSFMLVGFSHESEASRASARQALLVTAAGGLSLFAGFLLIGQAAGTFSVSTLLRTASVWQGHPLVIPGLICIFGGAFTKSAQFPFHFWLPNAMAAPTPVSAYLHSATMVKLGIYLLARLHPAFGDLEVWQVTLVSVGGLTSVWSMLLVLKERDLKRILAWSTVSALGTLVVLVGLPGEGAATAAAAFLLAHALYKAPLFFVAGNVDHSVGTRDIGKLSGLARRMPWTAAGALAAGLSMAGVPLSFGFVAKDLIKIAKDQGDVYTWVAYGGVLVSALSIAVAGVAAIRIFWQKGNVEAPEEIHEGPLSLGLPPVAIGALGIAFGVMPWLAEPLLVASAHSMRPGLDFAIVEEGVEGSAALIALAVSVALGVAFFLAWDRIHAVVERVTPHLPRGLTALSFYERALAGVPALASAVTRRVQHGALSGYVGILLLFVLGGVALSGAVAGAPIWPAMEWPSLAVGGAALGLVVAAVLVCVVDDTFVMLLVSGLVGLGCALLFLFLGAPDVAFTQFAVEVAFVVVIASILLRVRHLELVAPPRQPRWSRAFLSIAAGGLVAALLLIAAAGDPDLSLPRFFAERSVPDAHGRNVVNVILVDFRAVDTLGEVAVVAVTLLAVMPLIRGLSARARKERR